VGRVRLGGVEAELELAEHRRPWSRGWPRAEACVGERLGDLLARGGELHQAHAACTVRAHRHVDREHARQEPRPGVSGRTLARRRPMHDPPATGVGLGVDDAQGEALAVHGDAWRSASFRPIVTTRPDSQPSSTSQSMPPTDSVPSPWTLRRSRTVSALASPCSVTGLVTRLAHARVRGEPGSHARGQAPRTLDRARRWAPARGPERAARSGSSSDGAGRRAWQRSRLPGVNRRAAWPPSHRSCGAERFAGASVTSDRWFTVSSHSGSRPCAIHWC
jgi:hypothetical protein